MRKSSLLIASFGLMCATVVAQADEPENTPISPVRQGFYVAPLGSYTLTDRHWNAKDGYGGSLAGGYRTGSFAFELAGEYSRLGAAAASKDVELEGVGINALVFPFSSIVPNLYGLAGAGYTHGSNLFINVPDTNGPLLPPGPSTRTTSFSAQRLQAGIGNLFALSIGRYDFGIRAEALARYIERGSRNEDNSNDPRKFTDFVFSLGLQLPLSLRRDPVKPVDEKPVVVPVVSRCPNGVDYPTDKGCPAIEEKHESPPPPCKSPGPGERISLAGCGTGDVIVLRGVNFDFNQSRLTLNAKALLDDVVSELLKYVDLKIELGGHTDSKGSDAYNLRLSDQRAKSVMKYLEEHGIAGNRMTAVGFGESRPVADNKTDAGREANRRVELKILSGDTKTGGGVTPPQDSAPTPLEATDPTLDGPAEAAPASKPPT